MKTIFGQAPTLAANPVQALTGVPRRVDVLERHVGGVRPLPEQDLVANGKAFVKHTATELSGNMGTHIEMRLQKDPIFPRGGRNSWLTTSWRSAIKPPPQEKKWPDPLDVWKCYPSPLPSEK